MKIKNAKGEIVKAGCVILAGDKVLLVTNKKRTNWGFPKGHAESGEPAEEVALRETLEETGYTVEIIKPLPDLTYEHGETKEPIRVNMFLAKPVKRISRAEERYEWVDFEKAGALIYPNLKPYLRLAIRTIAES